jgi:hypothetical protein
MAIPDFVLLNVRNQFVNAEEGIPFWVSAGEQRLENPSATQSLALLARGTICW